MVSQPQVMYTRSGPQSEPEPDRAIRFRFTPSCRATTPTSAIAGIASLLDLTYGLGYDIEMPPYELQGKQVQLVDQADQPISLESYLQQKEKAALAGQVYEPTVGFATTPNVGRRRQVSVRSFLRRVQPANGGGLESPLQQRLLGDIRRQEDCGPRQDTAASTAG